MEQISLQQLSPPRGVIILENISLQKLSLSQKTSGGGVDGVGAYGGGVEWISLQQVSSTHEVMIWNGFYRGYLCHMI
jgi:hypothetical protein